LQLVAVDPVDSVVAPVVLPEAALAMRAPVVKVKVDQVDRREPAETVAHPMAEPGEAAEALALVDRADQVQLLAAAEAAVDTTVAVAEEPTSMDAAQTAVAEVVDHLGTTLL
jgi:hypothetical protein